MNAAGDRYRCVDVECFPLDGRRQAVRPARGTTTQVIPTSVMRVLESCEAFASLEDHGQRLAQALGLDERRARSVLEMLRHGANDGLLVSQADLCARIVAGAPDDPVQAIDTLGVVTKDRPEILERCIASYLHNARVHGRSLAVVVMDDSHRDAHRENRSMLAGLADDFGVEVEIAGAAEKRRFVKALVAEGIPAPVVEFALGNPLGWRSPIGANRNALQLATLGRRLLSSDDDMVCRATVADGTEGSRVAVASSGLLDVAFFRDREQMSQAAAFVEVDVLGAHAAVLGRSVAACLRDLPHSDRVLDLAGAEMLRALGEGRGRVALCESGYAGDSGTGPSTWVLGVDHGDRARYLGSPEDFALATTSREVIRRSPSYVISDAPHLMTGAVAFDHTQMLPPFMPVGRNEDGVFAAVLRACDPDAYLAHAPLALLHAPLEARAFPPDALGSSAGRFSLADVLCEMVTSRAEVHCRGANARMQRLGETLSLLGALDPREFEAWLRTFAWDRHCRSIASLHGVLDRYGDEPHYWANAVRDQIARIEAVLCEPDWFMPRGLPLVGSKHAAIDACRTMVGSMGVLLQHWPAIRDAVRRLAAQGVRPTSPADAIV